MTTRAQIAFFLLVCMFTGPAVLEGQTGGSHSADIWYFGRGAGLKFGGSGPPSLLHDGKLNTLDGSAIISDPLTGDLLFYTDGSTVWNREHTPMPNGTGLLGDESSGQPALIVPDPGSPTRYYLFTTGSHDVSDRTWRYNVIDITLDGGRGDVIEKNVPLLERGSEKLTATRHCDGRDYWMVTQEWGTNRFLAYHISPSGIDAPVVSQLGNEYPNGDDVQGTIHLSPDGSLVAVTSAGLQQLALLDFDPSTGSLFNYRIIGTGKNYYGGEFSPDQSRFYTVTLPHNMPAELIQFDLESGDPLTISASRTLLAEQSGVWPGGQLQIGPDGTIYVSFTGRQFLGRIAFPNRPGTACEYTDNAIDLAGKRTSYGLPNFIDSDLPNVGSGLRGVEVTLSPSDAHVVPGESVEWTLRVCNHNRFPISSIDLSVTLPEGIEYAGGSPSFPLLTTGMIRENSCREITFRGTVADSVPVGSRLDVCADVVRAFSRTCTETGKLCADVEVTDIPSPCSDTVVVIAEIADHTVNATGKRTRVPIVISGFPQGERIETFLISLRFDARSAAVDLEDEDDLTDEALTEDWDVSVISETAGEITLQFRNISGKPITTDGMLCFIPVRLYIPVGPSFPETALDVTFTLPEPCIVLTEASGFVNLDICGLDLRRIESLTAGRFRLDPPSVSPAMERADISFTLPIGSYISLTLFDITGKKVEDIIKGYHPAGLHSIIYPVAGLSDGTYILELQTGEWKEGRIISIRH